MTARSKAILTAMVLAAGLGAAGAPAQDISFTQIERGRYLATTANCVGCHTDVDNNGRPFAGGRGLETPFGVIYSPNITFDEETGLGRWNRDEFYRALHEGISREGEHLYPAFPYPYFTKMPRQDVDAIYEFLRTLEPVRAETPENELPFPFNIRQAVMGWNMMFFEQGEFVPDPDQSAEWNRGAYLVNGPAHCGACHTGKNALGADREAEFLAGGVLEDWLASDIRGGPGGGIEHWSQDDIVGFLRGGRNAHTAAMSRMGEVVAFSTQYMTDDDLNAVAIYLNTLEGEPRDAGREADQAVLEAGHAIYFDNCAACHQTDGSGVPYIFAPLDGSNKVRSQDPTTLIRIVLEGAQAHPTETYPAPIAMPAFNWKLTDDQIADVLTYVRNSWGNAAPPVSASEVGDMREVLAE